MVSDKKLFQCARCEKKYSELDSQKLLFFPATGICHECYQDAKENKPHHEWCFGKPDLIKNGKVVAYGYDPLTQDCKQDCPDRKVCPLYVTGKIVQLQQEVVQNMADETEVTTEETTQEKPKAPAKKVAVAKKAPAKKPVPVAVKKAVVKTPAKVTPSAEATICPYTERSALHPIFLALLKGADFEILAAKAKLDAKKTRARMARDGRGRFPGYAWSIEDVGNKQFIRLKK